jgi:tetrahydromethanopterin S-methyltransferase subunit G
MEENVEVKPASGRSIGIKWGLIGSGIGVALFVVYNVLKIDFTSGPISWLQYVFIVGFIFLAQKQFKDDGDSYMSFGQGMGVAFWYGLASSIVSSIFIYIYTKFIDGSMFDTIKENQLKAMQEKGGMSDEQIDQAMEISGKFMTPEVFLGTGFFFGIIGVLVIGLIVTIFTQKKNPEAIV